MTEPVLINLDVLRALLARVEAATADTAGEIEPDLLRALGIDATTLVSRQDHPFARLQPLTVTDDALALVERLLPDWRRLLKESEAQRWDCRSNSWCASFDRRRPGPGHWLVYGVGATPTLALCAALLRVLIAKGDADDT